MQNQIDEITGVWTSEEVKNIKDWIIGEGLEELQKSQELAKEQSKKIQEIAHVDMDKLKVPFTFIS